MSTIIFPLHTLSFLPGGPGWDSVTSEVGWVPFLWSWGPLRGGPTRPEWQSPAEIKKTGFPVPTVMFPAPPPPPPPPPSPPPPPHDSLSLDPSTRPSTSNLNPFVSLWLKPGLLYQRCYRGQRPRWVWIPLLWEGTSRRWTGVQAPCEMRERGSVDVMPNSCWAQSSHSPSDVFFFFFFLPWIYQ